MEGEGTTLFPYLENKVEYLLSKLQLTLFIEHLLVPKYYKQHRAKPAMYNHVRENLPVKVRRSGNTGAPFEEKDHSIPSAEEIMPEHTSQDTSWHVSVSGNETLRRA